MAYCKKEPHYASRIKLHTNNSIKQTQSCLMCGIVSGQRKSNYVVFVVAYDILHSDFNGTRNDH